MGCTWQSNGANEALMPMLLARRSHRPGRHKLLLKTGLISDVRGVGLNPPVLSLRCPQVLDKGLIPATRHVRGSNFCLMQVFPDHIEGRAVVISVIDNLVKGASGQALQNMNLMMGFPETTALMQLAMFP